MDITCNYLGLTLKHPFVMGASPLVDHLSEVRRIEDAGAAAIVMHSLFEEQLHAEVLHQHHTMEVHGDSSAEASSYFPAGRDYGLGPHEYLEQLHAIKRAVDVPVLGSLNGTTPSGWLEFAALIEQAGADALEMNVYSVATDPTRRAQDVEDEIFDVLRQLSSRTRLPIAIKLSPFYTSLPNFASRLVDAGVHGLVLFNRFYQPDIDIDELEVTHVARLSDSSELQLRLRWLAILSAQLETDFAVTGGVHDVRDGIKALMTGANVVQLVSEVLQNGPGCFSTLPRELSSWLEAKEYDNLGQLRGSMNLGRCPNPRAYERANYIKILQSWQTSLDTMA